MQKAKKLNETFFQLIEQVFQQKRYPEQLYRSCDGLFRLQRKTEPDEFRKACLIALKYNKYSYHFLRNIDRKSVV